MQSCSRRTPAGRRGVVARAANSLTVLFVLVSLAAPAVAAEGMWMPDQLPALEKRLRASGFEGDPNAFADLTGHPMGAVVSLGGCSASFVSPDGLIVTNHHCAIGSLQYNSTPEANLIEDGFLAKTRRDEPSNGPGARVRVAESIRDVTDAIRGNVPAGTSDTDRAKLLEDRVKKATAACETDGRRCVVRSFFGGSEYYEIKYLEIRDVRLVYAPPSGIGVFGGETDNFMWPRHTGDWTFYRAYVGPDGEPARYSKDNVPYRPKHWLRVSTEGVAPGDVVFVVGYPGRTSRHRTLAEVRNVTEWSFPRSLRIAEDQIAILRALGKESPELAIKVEARIRGLENGHKYRSGVLAGLVGGGILARKAERERALAAWIREDDGARELYDDVLPELDALQARREATREHDAAFTTAAGSSALLRTAMRLYRLSHELPKPDAERDPGYQERDHQRIRDGLERMQRTFDVAIDRAMLRYGLGEVAALPADQRVEIVDELVGWSAEATDEENAAKTEAFLEGLYDATRLHEPGFRRDAFGKSTEELLETGDPLFAIADKLEPLRLALEAESDERSGIESRLRPRYVDALRAAAGGRVSPDANGTLRVTFGNVEGARAPKDGLSYVPLTSLEGIVQKHTGEGDFDAPEALLEAIATLRDGGTTRFRDAHLGDVPVNFLSSVDTTGGNSGSPTLNAKGELVGLLFDGTFESIAADYLFDPDTTRSIHVDARYMLWVMEAVDGADTLLEELGVAPRADAGANTEGAAGP